jgi:hypothetical protein
VSDETEAEVLEAIVKNVRLLCDTWPTDAETRVAVFERQLAVLDAIREASA